jgi:hypothetical protein
MDAVTGYMTVEGKSIPFTKTTAVCAMGAVEAALMDDTNLRPAQRLELYREIENTLDAALQPVNDDFENYYMNDARRGYAWFVEDQKEYGIPVLTFEDWFDLCKNDYRISTSEYHEGIMDFNDRADSKTFVIEVFDEALRRLDETRSPAPSA